MRPSIWLRRQHRRSRHSRPSPTTSLSSFPRLCETRCFEAKMHILSSALWSTLWRDFHWKFGIPCECIGQQWKKCTNDYLHSTLIPSRSWVATRLYRQDRPRLYLESKTYPGKAKKTWALQHVIRLSGAAGCASCRFREEPGLRK